MAVLDGDSPVGEALPRFMVQIIFVVTLSRILGVICHRVKQPMVIAEMVCIKFQLFFFFYPSFSCPIVIFSVFSLTCVPCPSLLSLPVPFPFLVLKGILLTFQDCRDSFRSKCFWQHTQLQ